MIKMKIFNFFNKKGQNHTFPRLKYHPENICDIQDPEQSLLCGTTYDMSRFSKHEAYIIKKVLSAAKQKYDNRYAAIGLANESYPIKYKPRYVVFEVLIQRHSGSENWLDKVAVAFAFLSKGSKYFFEAARFFEEAKDYACWDEVLQFSSLYGIFFMFSDMYEKIHDYEKAIDCVGLCVEYNDLDKKVASERIATLVEKRRSAKPYNPRKMSQQQAEFEELVSAAAKKYL